MATSPLLQRRFHRWRLFRFVRIRHSQHGRHRRPRGLALDLHHRRPLYRGHRLCFLLLSVGLPRDSQFPHGRRTAVRDPPYQIPGPQCRRSGAHDPAGRPVQLALRARRHFRLAGVGEHHRLLGHPVSSIWHRSLPPDHYQTRHARLTLNRAAAHRPHLPHSRRLQRLHRLPLRPEGPALALHPPLLRLHGHRLHHVHLLQQIRHRLRRRQ